MSNIFEGRIIDIKIKYVVNKKSNIRIIGEEFVKNNKDNCRILYKKKIYPLGEFFDGIEKNIAKNRFMIYLRILKDLTDMSYMFYGCDSVLSIPKIIPSKSYYVDIKKIDDDFAKDISIPQSKEEEEKYENINLFESQSFYADCEPLLALSGIDEKNSFFIDSESNFIDYEEIILSSINDLSDLNTVNAILVYGKKLKNI